jgi:hypothetical protein
MTNAAADRWHFGDRWYAITLTSDVLTRDGVRLELDDVAPAPGRGTVLEAFYDDTTGRMTFTAFANDPLPFELVEQFITEARRRLPPIRE